MYTLKTKLGAVTGVGSKTSAALQEQNIATCKDLLLQLPLRYINRSQIVTIADLSTEQDCSFIATVNKPSSFYKNRRKITSAVAKDSTGSVKLMWFNNSFISKSLKPEQTYMISGKIGKNKTIIQPTLEIVKPAQTDQDFIHTGRLVPIYSSMLKLQQGKLRRLLHTIASGLDTEAESTKNMLLQPSIEQALKELHFPQSEDAVIIARERLALEELLALIKISEETKKHWRELSSAASILAHSPIIPTTIPFELTGAQLRCIQEIIADISQKTPMNRMLLGDVGSGKTVVAGVAAYHVIQSGRYAALIAPTKILATQHYQTISTLFPNLPIELVTGKTSTVKRDALHAAAPAFLIGTHALINTISKLNPALVIYDEQHRFGVTQRSQTTKLEQTAHTLTMSATPIPRSLLLTIFSHLAVSILDELPKGRIPTKTWVVSEEKRKSAYEWIRNELTGEDTTKDMLALIVCPFIDPSEHEAFEGIASAKETYETAAKLFPQNRVALLHGQMKPEEQQHIITKLYDKKIDILVTTPIVEVGVDLPTASIIVIEAAQRFGMASLHQLRGRVGRAGQQGYCLLFNSSESKTAAQRLEKFSRENNGLKLAEIDLQTRGSGDIFGTQQSGFSELKFANWTNGELISKAKKIYEQLPENWEFFFEQTDRKIDKPLAN